MFMSAFWGKADIRCLAAKRRSLFAVPFHNAMRTLMEIRVAELPLSEVEQSPIRVACPSLQHAVSFRDWVSSSCIDGNGG